MIEPAEKPDGCYNMVISVDTLADSVVVRFVRDQGGCDD